MIRIMMQFVQNRRAHLIKNKVPPQAKPEFSERSRLSKGSRLQPMVEELAIEGNLTPTTCRRYPACC
jgi:hypothetical protein